MSLMKKNGIKTNYFYNLIYEVFALLTPLITAPYVSRVLGSDGIGQYSFVTSIASYFILIGTLGFTYHALRELASLQGMRKEQSKVFWEIFFARLGCVFAVLTVFVITVVIQTYGRYTYLMAMMGIQIVSVAFDISFLFQSNDIFGIIAARNMLIKILAISSIFLFVKKENDLWIYVLIQVLINLISNLSLWTKLHSAVDFVPVKNLNILRHFKPSFALFVPQIAISVYNILDKTLIGLLIKGQVTENVDGVLVTKMISDIENGYYEQSQKIITMSMTVFTSLSTVLIARNANEIASGNRRQLQKNINGAIDYLFFIGAPICFGLCGVAQVFSPWFFGDGYDKTPFLIMIFSPMVLIVGLSNILGRQYMNPSKMDKEFTEAIFVGAGTNLILNLILIPMFKSYGAAIASVIAEFSVTFVMGIILKKEISIWDRMKRAWRIWIASIAMFGLVFFIQSFLLPGAVSTFLIVGIGALIYFVILFVMREPYLYTAISVVKPRIQRKKT